MGGADGHAKARRTICGNTQRQNKLQSPAVPNGSVNLGCTNTPAPQHTLCQECDAATSAATPQQVSLQICAVAVMRR